MSRIYMDPELGMIEGILLEDMPAAKTVLADVPYPYVNTMTRAAAVRHYQLMTLEELMRFKFPHDDGSCLLLFWAWNPAMHDCLHIIESWGFGFKGIITWVKPHMGLGNYVRNATEHLLLAAKGKVKPPCRRQLSWFIAERGEHSRKPEAQYDIAERLGETPRLELFARRPRPGWWSWGDEL